MGPTAEGGAPAAAPWLRYVRYFSGQRPLLAWALLGALVRVSTMLPVPLLVESVLTGARSGADSRELLLLGAALLGLQVGSGAVQLWSRTRIHAAVLEVTRRLRIEALRRVLTMPPARAEELGAARLHDQILHETERVEVAGRLVLADLLPSALATLGLALGLAAIDPRLLAVLAALAPLYALAHLAPGRGLRHAAAERNRTCLEFGREVLRGLRALDQAHSQGAEAWLLERQRAELDGFQAATAQALVLGERSRALQQALVVLGSLAVLVAGGLWVASGQLTVEELAGFFAGLALIRGPASMLLASAPPIAEGRTSLESLFALLDEPAAPPGGTVRLERFDGRVSLRGVSFAYGSRQVLDAVDLEVGPGRCVAVVGAIGAGKSTLLRVVLGMLRSTRGEVVVAGHPVGELEPAHYRSQLAYLPQDPVLLPGSVRDNVLFGRAAGAGRELEDSLQLVGADAWLRQRAEGVDGPVGDEGVLLSGGQRQQVALARVLFGRPRLLLLDEPSNHLSACAARELVERLRTLPWRPGLLLVTHDPAVAGCADEIHRLAGGKLEP